MPMLSFQFHADGMTVPGQVSIERVVIAGWTGRDPTAIQHHIDELVAIGVKPPSTVPLYYRVSASLVTQAPAIQVLGNASSGEIEPVIFAADGRLWLTLGSDHTDREAESAGVALSKQLCAKPVAREAWLWDEFRRRPADGTGGAHDAPGDVDRLLLTSSIVEAGVRVPYQQGSLAQIRPLAALMAGLEAAHGVAMSDGTMMFCGTLSALGGVRGSSRFSGRLEDPPAGRTISLDYAVEILPVVA